MSEHNQEHETSEALPDRQLLLQEIGNKLNQARQAKKEHLNKAVRHLKIPLNHMQALESANWDSLPDDVYVIGFLRQYSNYLGIDLSEEINRLKNSDYTLTRPLTFPDPPVAPSRRWAWLTGAAFALLFIAFNVISNNDTPTINAPAQNIAPMANNDPHINATTINPHPDHAQLTNKSSFKPTPPKLQVGEQKGLPKAPALPTTSFNPTLAAAPALLRDKPRMHSYRFKAVTAPVWLQLFAPNKAGNGKGHLLKELLLKKGQHTTIRHSSESLWITCGNARALRIQVDQKTVVKTGTLGTGKKVLRDYHFKINHH